MFCDSMLTSAFLLQYGAEFRRFSVDRLKPGKFEEFYKLIMTIHRIANMEVMIGYADVHGDLLPINNDENFCKAVSTAHPLLRLFIQRQGTSSLTSHPHPFIQGGFSCFIWSIVWWLVLPEDLVDSLKEALHTYIGFKFFWPQLRIGQLGVKNPAECRVWIK